MASKPEGARESGEAGDDGKLPWIKFFPGDWWSDKGLRSCSRGARGLWMDMLCIMHESGQPGMLMLNGQAISVERLSNLVGGSLHRVRAEWKELETAGVFSRDAEGTIYSRRMVRDARRRLVNRENGAKGGNPAIRSATETGNSVENSDNRNSNRNVVPRVRNGVVSDNPEPACASAQAGADECARDGERASAREDAPERVTPPRQEARVQSLEEDPPPPELSVSAKLSAFGADVVEIVHAFEAGRLRGWPCESRLPAPSLTLGSQARAWLDAGAPVALILDVLDRQFGRLLAKGERHPPGDLQFCGLTMEREIGRYLTAKGSPGLSDSGSARGVDAGSSSHDPAEAQRRARLSGYRETGFWLEEWGPEPADDEGRGS